MPILLRDFETRGVLDLEKVGAWRYASHPDSDAICCAYCVDDEPVKLWLPGDDVPPEWIEAARNPDWLAAAFNDSFERAIEQHIMAPRYGWPLIPSGQHRCLQASALAHALPGSLETAALALSLTQPKDKAGRANMLALARPRKPGKGEPPGFYWIEDPARRARLYSYCKQDVQTERAVYRRIGFITPEEQEVWELDALINDRGIHIDDKLASAAIRLAGITSTEIDAELAAITGGAVSTIQKVQKLLGWLNDQGCAFKNIGKETLARALDGRNLSGVARRAIELRLDGAHATANKFKTMLAWRSADGRIRGALKYHGASTGRWSSHGVQLQNLKRPVTEDLGAAIEAVATGDIDHLRAIYTRPMAVIGDITRATITAAPGHQFYAADYSGIEARVTCLACGRNARTQAMGEVRRNARANGRAILDHR